MMYVVLVNNKTSQVLYDAVPELRKEFPNETFTVVGSEDNGYQLRILGVGDEKKPRKFAEAFIKKWKPQPIFIEP